MTAVNPVAREGQIFSRPVMEKPDHIYVDRNSSNMKEHLVHSNLNDDGSVMHFSVNKSRPAFGLNAVATSKIQLTIFYNGRLWVYSGIPAEKLREIMLIAAATAKSAEMKTGTESPFTSLIPSCPSRQGTTNNLASTQTLCFPAEKSSICRLQEFPIARRQSLQRFLEKRRNRLGSKSPYPTSAPKKVADNIENYNFCADNAPDLVSLKRSAEGFQPSIFAS